MEKSLLDLINRNVITNRWMNNKAGKFEYSSQESVYRFIETTDDLRSYLFYETERDDENTPIVIKGFLSFLIACWGQSEVGIYNSYNERKKKAFLEKEYNKPGACDRNLEKEFAVDLLDQEQQNIQDFTDNFDYISEEEKSQILEFPQYYLGYTAKQYNIDFVDEAKCQFENLLLSKDNTQLLILLHSILDNSTAKGKDIAIAMICLEELGLLGRYGTKRALYRMLEKEFGSIGTESNFNIYFNQNNRNRILPSEIDSIRISIQRNEEVNT